MSISVRQLGSFSLVCLLMGALCGLFGFVIIYHYATYERPMLRFAIIVDAGSTQTRSSLYAIQLDAPTLLELSSNRKDTDPWMNHSESSELAENKFKQTFFKPTGELSLSSLVRIKQVGTCINGGPLASIRSEVEAKSLIRKCLSKFAQHIMKLDFVERTGGGDFTNFDDYIIKIDESKREEDDDESGAIIEAEAREANRLINGLSHRVSSKTRLHLGATAGMRALAELNRTRAGEKLHWVDQALYKVSVDLAERGVAPVINKGFVGIIEGAQEALFGWLSVNFISDRLKVGRSASKVGAQYMARSVGTIELGGASAQMAFEAPEDLLDSESIRNMSLQEQNLRLFNSPLRLATRSDLCLGMSQAILRANYLIMRDAFASRKSQFQHQATPSSNEQLENPCFQNKSRTNLTGGEINQLFSSPCLVASQNDEDIDYFRAYVSSLSWVSFVGTGDTEKCSTLLTKLIEPSKCGEYFSLCPESRIQKHLPSSMPFVTISGYNKALYNLDLKAKQPDNKTISSKLERIIAIELGGYSIDYSELVSKTKDYCSLDVGEFPVKYPKMKKLYYSINCLQLVYIRKLLTEYYSFSTETGHWDQIKFLLFPIGLNSAPRSSFDSQISADRAKQNEQMNDIGWSLGLLINATNYEFSQASDIVGQQLEQFYHHHGASVMFLLRVTMVLMLSCFLVFVFIIALSAFVIRYRHRNRSSYISYSTSSGLPEV